MKNNKNWWEQSSISQNKITENQNNSEPELILLEEITEIPRDTTVEDNSENQLPLLETSKKEIKEIPKILPGSFALLLSQIMIGGTRDILWGATTFCNLDLFKGRLGNFLGPTLTQMIITSVPMLGAVNLNNGAGNFNTYTNLFFDGKRDWFKKQLIFAFSSWSAIPAWNAAQLFGSFVGKTLGFNSKNSGYFSGIFAGIAETVWQNAMVIPLLMKQPFEVLEVLLNTLGGAIWQWVYQANLPNSDDQEIIFSSDISELESKDLIVGLKIASAVAASTLMMTLIAWGIDKCYSQKKSNRKEVRSNQQADEETSLLVVNRGTRSRYGAMDKQEKVSIEALQKFSFRQQNQGKKSDLFLKDITKDLRRNSI